MNDFCKKTVLVTGGTSGMGEACAIRFAKENANVVVAGRNKEKGKMVVERMNAAKDSCGGGIAISI